MNPTILQTIERAIAGGFKIRYQTESTPEFDFIIFHPHTMRYNASGYCVRGLVERHYAFSKSYYPFEQDVAEIRFIEILPIQIRQRSQPVTDERYYASRKEIEHTEAYASHFVKASLRY